MNEQTLIEILLNDHTVRVVALGALVLGLVSGCLGSFAVLRQQSLLGDAIAHATLPGVGIAFLITQSKNPFVLLVGAAIAGWVGTLLVMLITRTTRIKKDAGLGIVLSVFFAVGVMILTIIQRLPTASKAGLDKFLFGNAATLLSEDVTLMIVLGVLVLAFVFVFWKEFKILTFDEDFAKSLGFPVRMLDILLTTLIVIAIVIGLQTVGVVLMSAMLVAPAAAARQWTDRLEVMVFLSAMFGALAGVCGALMSSLMAHLPTGPTIVVFLSLIVMGSLLFAPRRGLVSDWIRAYRQRRAIQLTTMLKNFLLFSEINDLTLKQQDIKVSRKGDLIADKESRGGDPFHPHDIAALRAIGRGALHRTMVDLQKKKWAVQHPDKRWALTPEGLREARRVTKAYEERFNVDGAN
jgi:manganese/zinc/iron transport system permease protein